MVICYFGMLYIDMGSNPNNNFFFYFFYNSSKSNILNNIFQNNKKKNHKLELNMHSWKLKILKQQTTTEFFL